MTGKVENVAHGRGAKRIDRLRVVTNHGEAPAVGPQRQKHRGLKLVGILIFVDKDVIETRRDFVGDRALLHHVRPVEQKVVIVEHMLLLLDLDISREKRAQFVLPGLAPRKMRADDLVERQFTVHRAGINGETGALGREALLRLREAQVVANEVHQVRGILPVVNGEGRR